MWLLIFLFLIVTALLGWLLFGYLLTVYFVSLFRKRPDVRLPEEMPFLSIVVPCFNEEACILSKLDDLRNQAYDRDRMEIVFADGGSSDATVSALRSAIRDGEPIRVVECPESGKILQLNHVLPGLRGEIVVNTDADSRLEPEALKWLAAEFSDPEVFVAGAYCRPGDDALEVERYYWSAQNKGRFMESDARTASIVIAQCYAFRRQLLDAFPPDVVADDIYVAFLANTQRLRTVYSRRARAVETRSPRSYREFLPHKFRKSNAFLRESLRFIYRLPEMRRFCKVMMATRVAQQLLLPWLALFWILLAGVLLTLFRFDIVAFSLVMLLVLFVGTSRIFAVVELPADDSSYTLATIVKGYILTNVVMLSTGASYPFFMQGCSYRKLSSCRSSGMGDDSQSGRDVAGKSHCGTTMSEKM